MGKPRVVVHADVPFWAWGRKGAAYKKHLSDEFEITVAFNAEPPDYSAADLVHLFEVSQISRVPAQYRGKKIAGLTANVWRTWGAERMLAWAAQVDALHGNSVLIAQDLRQFHPRVHYTPNGVDTDFWYRMRPRTVYGVAALIACHVGKPNPRKGAPQLVAACEQARVTLRLVQRTSHIAKPWEDLREMYQDAHVQLTMSDMDGTPNPMLESAACENMLISTRVGNMPQLIVDGRNGFLIGPEPDPETGRIDQDALIPEYVEKLQWCAAHPDETSIMGQHAREDIEADWTWAIQCEKVRAMWREVLG
jgi:glycosyltransferase involved in cell wall biosynthesis